MMILLSVDLDGTLTTNAYRSERLVDFINKNGPLNEASEETLNELMKDVLDDEPTKLVQLVRFWALGHELVILSGRPASCLTDTTMWLYRHGIVPTRLILRKHGETHLDATAWKRRELVRLQPSIHIDDDPELIAPENTLLLRVCDVEGHHK